MQNLNLVENIAHKLQCCRILDKLYYVSDRSSQNESNVYIFF